MAVKHRAKKHNPLIYFVLAIISGVSVGLLYLGFEWVVNHGSNWLWNEVVQSDTYRWRVIPLAVIMSIALSIVIVFLRKKRVQPAPAGLLDELDHIQPSSLTDIGHILLIGALSLIAGASLGPEASLVAAVLGVAALLSGKVQALQQPFAFTLSLANVGALLAAFFNSLLPVIIPLLILKKKNALTGVHAIVAILAGTCAWFVVHSIKGEAYIQIPVSEVFSLQSVLLATLLGFAAVLIAALVNASVKRTFPLAERVSRALPWVMSAAVFGLVLGVIYFAGGQTIQFSGSEGLKLLSSNPAEYGAAALVGLVLTKLLATAWSTASGYRGGLVFPSIYIGQVVSLLVISVFGLSGAGEVGSIIGAITGILVGMLSPIIGIVLALALFPVSLYAVVICAAIGALIAQKLISYYVSSRSQNA